jgi:hypothetical protein
MSEDNCEAPAAMRKELSLRYLLAWRPPLAD